MKILRIASLAVLAAAAAGMILWKIAVPEPDWLVRLEGILMLLAAFAAVFSTVRIALSGNKAN